MKESVLKRFKVNVNDLLNQKVVLSDLALKSQKTNTVFEQIDNKNYTQEELSDTAYLLCKLVDKLDLENDLGKNKTKKVKDNISDLVNDLLTRKKDTISPNLDEETVRQRNLKLLKCLRFLTEILQKTNLDAGLVRACLTDIANSYMVCFIGRKEVLDLWFVEFCDDISKQYDDFIIDKEEDIVKEELNKVFYEAKIHTSNKLILELINLNLDELTRGEEPHYKHLCREILNDTYNFNLEFFNVEDSLFTPKKKKSIQEKFINLISKYDIDLLVYSEARDILRDRLTKDSKGNEILLKWVKDYIKDHNLEIDAIEFLTSEVVTEDFKPRYVALNELIRYSGFITIVDTDLNIQNEFGDTALITACKLDASKDVIELLIDKGSDLNIQNNFGDTALITACKIYASKDVIELLIDKGSDLHIQNNFGDTALITACKLGASKDVIELLIDKGSDLHIRNKLGCTALITTCKLGTSKDVIELLIDKGSDLNIQNEFGDTALITACKLGASKDVIELLIDKGSDLNIQNNGGGTALVCAWAYPGNNIVDILLKKGADLKPIFRTYPVTPSLVNRLSSIGVGINQIFVTACETNTLHNIDDYLLNQGVDLEKALIYAYESNAISETITDLMNRGANINKALIKAYENNASIEVIRTLINKGADINTRDENGLTALMIACKNNVSKEKIQILLGKDVNMNSQNNYFKIFTYIKNILKWIYGKIFSIHSNKKTIYADVNMQDRFGNTALMYAYKNNVSEEIIQVLLDNGSDISIKNNDGYTAQTIPHEDNTSTVLVNKEKMFNNNNIPQVELNTKKRNLNDGKNI